MEIINRGTEEDDRIANDEFLSVDEAAPPHCEKVMPWRPPVDVAEPPCLDVDVPRNDGLDWRLLRMSSAAGLSIALVVVFLGITIGITLYKLINGTILIPRMFPEVTNLSSTLNLFTVVPVLVIAYIYHYNGK